MTNAPILIRYFQPGSGARVGILRGETVHDISHCFPNLTAFFRDSVADVAGVIAAVERAADAATRRFPASDLDNPPAPALAHWLPPLDEQEVWAAGVTYTRSREARQEESSDGGDVYARVYDAPRPEIFYKASAKNTVGHLDNVGIRSDSQWNVPEPELGLAINPAMELLGFTIGNDMSSRDIEGANPLYLPQAKLYTASCALGPGILLAPSEQWLATTIRLDIARADEAVFSSAISTDQIKRGIAELIDYLGRSNSYPGGVFLLTGTGIVPPAEFTLLPGDEVRIGIDSIGELRNTVIEV
ncbi:MAG: fumarylacetoacetate hydrolase family protein [Chloroflexi bacterium]|nr:fumarylacetoacetate hydrolase family protein [Chloroflexota bacterium]MCY3583446.1 fumarylacetoacetate hydrolase family protein [Chloroflexota bacterium]MCY3715064.1 fumarylacetoacetate hydrolase family protein [Chloroflexota bacterium]MDE2651611.1 fumarylacetoacetate hydrolase family protein [Chloroflexota bacterium]